MRYLLDANALIEPKNRYYPFSICPGFWDWLDTFHANGRVHSITAVRNELIAGKDDLASWARDRPRFFLSPTSTTVPGLTALAEWAESHDRYTRAAKSDFLRKADFQLIALAAEHGAVVVTHEQSAPESRRRIMIPDACAVVGVATATLHEMVSDASPRFVLDSAA